MPRIPFSSKGNTPFEQLLGHHEEILKCWTQLEHAFSHSATLSLELKEEVRRTLAHLNGCQYCMAKGRPSPEIADKKIAAAVKFATLLTKDHRKITDHQIDILSEVFKPEEISELCAYICFTTACQQFGAVLDLTPSCEVKLVK